MIIILGLMACVAGLIVKMKINKRSTPVAILIPSEKNLKHDKRNGQRLK